MMKRISFFTFLFLLFSVFNVFADDLSIKLDKKTASIADVVYLTVIYTGDKKIAPELANIKKDFSIVSTSSSSQINFINGDMSQSKKWTFGLQPLHTGKITISPIRVDNLISNSAEVEITDVSDVAYAPDKKENSNSPFFKIKQKMDTETPYVQQQVLLYVNVYDSVGLQEGGPIINEESKKDWIIVPINEQPIVRQKTVDYRQMNVLTYAFAIFPQKSGEIKAPEITFDGYYIRSGGFGLPGLGNDFVPFGIDLNSILGQRVPVHLKAKAETITVLPIPDNYSAKKWLPLSDLELNASWSVKNGFKVGEAVSRTIDLKAIGMMEGMLPQINFKEADGLKQYPEKPTFEQKIDNGKIVTTAQYNNVYIPTKAGEITVPEIKLQWFNVLNKKFETATIPEETIFVLPNPEIENNEPTLTKEDSTQKVSEKKNEEQTTVNEEKKKTEETKNIDIFSQIKTFIQTYLFAIILALALLLLCLLHTKQKKKHIHRDAVIRALKKHDYKKAKDALLDWARYKFYPVDINNFNDISCLVKDNQFSEQLSALNKFLYSTNTEYFDAAKFIEILKKVDKIQLKQKKNTEVLPNLYD